ncbi:SsgA family sporulation/cell division regulator [Nonomuraea guangzhouensis]|uniref:SsgA family sporulation/cell division regulator n=1 Tax=Nonomuraea guangzhouensis TaxID=1291555 RepID=A0ABW4GX25_9ACTN|nr:SsgA family sporulation/cell division regulator [Nonomuraea guangzhouensis]
MDPAITHQWPFTLWETGPVNPAHPATLIYRATTPHLIEMAVEHTEYDTVTRYQVDRSLLTRGMERRVGDNDVTVRPHPTVNGWVTVQLLAYSGATEFHADAVVIQMFLDHIAFIGQAETFDVDALTARLLEVTA